MTKRIAKRRDELAGEAQKTKVKEELAKLKNAVTALDGLGAREAAVKEAINAAKGAEAAKVCASLARRNGLFRLVFGSPDLNRTVTFTPNHDCEACLFM